jgi:hypothetical protein
MDCSKILAAAKICASFHSSFCCRSDPQTLTNCLVIPFLFLSSFCIYVCVDSLSVMRSFFFSPIIAIILNIQSIAAFCYNPDGSQVTDLSFQPCNQVSGTVSMCCGTNHTGGIDPDVCQPNGLCKNTGDNIQWRESCTDASWKSPYCLKFCTGGPVSRRISDVQADADDCSEAVLKQQIYL